MPRIKTGNLSTRNDSLSILTPPLPPLPLTLPHLKTDSKKPTQIRVKDSIFIEHFLWLPLNGELGKVKKSKLKKRCKCPEAATGDALYIVPIEKFSSEYCEIF